MLNWNACRYRVGQRAGHYESYFQRANHPTLPQAFWIRYTIFSPEGRPQDALGELWAIYFDAAHGPPVALKAEFPLSACHFDPSGLLVTLPDALLHEGVLEGEGSSDVATIRWSLTYRDAQAPLFLLPDNLYEGGFPKAKSLVGAPLARFDGTLEVNGKVVSVEGWPGSQNHNWGRRHTDHYAWGQVAGFDNAPDAFLECITARVKIGPVWTPFVTWVVVRYEGDTWAFNKLLGGAMAEGRFDHNVWTFASSRGGARVSGRIHAPSTSFVALPYANPPGGTKTCLNTKIAACELTLTRPGRAPVQLHSAHRAAFEILHDP